MIDFFNVKKQYQQDREAYLDLADRVYSSGQVINGEYCRRLEESLKQRTDRKHCVLTASCTDALAFAGWVTCQGTDKVALFPNLSFPATNNGFIREIKHTCAVGYVDTDSNGIIDLERLEEIFNDIDNNFKIFVVWVNLFGHVVDYDRIFQLQMRYSNVQFVEDAAQSFGGFWRGYPSGGLGYASTVSFDPTKNLNAFGLGGALLSDSSELIDAVDLHRRPHTASWINHGYNSQINEIDAAMVWWKLENRFDQWQKRRTEIAEYYVDNLKTEYVEPAAECVSAWHKFVIKHKNRDQLKQHLEDSGVQTRVHYKQTLSNTSETPIAENLTKKCLSLPIYPELSDSEVEAVVDRVNASVELLS